MKIKILTLLFLFSGGLKAQVVLENLTEYEAIDLNLYSVGDTIQFNIGSNNGYFENIFNPGFSVNGEIQKNGRVKVSKDLQIKYPYKNKKAIIKDIIKRTEGKNQIIYFVVLSGLIKDYVDINEAIKSKEIVNESTKYMQFFTNYFDEKVGYLYYLGLTELEDQNVLEYMYRFENKKFDLYINDEFEFQNKKEETKRIILKEIEKVKSQDYFYFNVKVDFDEYNFENTSFSTNLADLYSIINQYRFTHEPHINIFTTLGIDFNNSKDYNTIIIDKESAKKLIENKKNWEGKIIRTLYAKVFFKIDDTSSQNYNLNRNEEYLFKGNIFKIEYYSNEKCNDMVYSKEI